MREYKYDYTISPDNSPQQFKEFCRKIGKAYPDYITDDLLVDVDGSTIQVFSCEGKEIVVYDDYDIGAVFAVSDVDLTKIISESESEEAA